MAEASFQVERALRVDLGKGELTGSDGRLVALPGETLLALVRAVEATAESAVALYAAGREWGESAGQRIAEQVASTSGKPAREASTAVILDQVSGRLASCGWGTVSLEIWGEGLVFVLANAPVQAGSASRHLLAGFFAGLAGGITGGTFAGAAVGSGPDLRVLVGNPGAIKAARLWHEQGAGLGAIVDRLRAGDHRREP